MIADIEMVEDEGEPEVEAEKCPACDGTGEKQERGSNDPIEITLRTPITIKRKQRDDRIITKLTIRPMTGRDMRHMPNKEGFPMVGIMWLAGKLSGETNQAIDQLMGMDLRETIDAVNHFFGDSQETGDEPSES